MNNYRYNDYYLVNDADMIDDESIELVPKKKCGLRQVLYTSSIM